MEAGARSAASDWRSYRRQVASAAEALIASGQSPGVVVHVRDGRRALTVARGLADVAADARMRSRLRFRIGSISKTFVAAALLQLASEDALALDDPLEQWLPGVVPNGASITIRHILMHTSGLANYTDDPDFSIAYRDDREAPWEPEDLLAIAFESPPYSAPGAAFHYSNTNYVLAGLLLEAVAGLPAGESLEQLVLRPARLRHVAFEEDADVRRASRGYYVYGNGSVEDVSRYHPTAFWGAGNVGADARDVARFFRSLLGGRLLPDEELAAMKALGSTPDEPYLTGYGLGLYQTQFGGCAPWWGHDGRVDGYVSIAANSDDGARQVILLVNTSSATFTEGPGFELFQAAWCGLPQ
jgi:D-alanyl-D-alanine carboxypeptidase